MANWVCLICLNQVLTRNPELKVDSKGGHFRVHETCFKMAAKLFSEEILEKIR